METRANYIAVGIFTCLALLASFGVVYWFSNIKDVQNVAPLDIHISGSVSGLGRDSVVQFNGINVGRVLNLSLDPNDPRNVIVHTEVNQSTPLRTDTKATVGTRGLSGGAYIQLQGGSPNSARLLIAGADNSTTPVLKGDPTAITDLFERVNVIMARTDTITQALGELVNDNKQVISHILKNTEAFSAALANNSEGLGQFMDNAGKMSVALGGLAGKLDKSVQQAEAILAAVDPQQVANTLTNAEKFSQSLGDQSAELASLMQKAQTTADQLNAFSAQLSSTLTHVDAVVKGVDPAQVSSTLKSLDQSAQHAERLLAVVDESKIISVIDNVNKTAAHANNLLTGIDQAAVATLITEAQKASKSVTLLLSSIDGNKVGEAMENISKAAVNANGVVADIRKITEPLGERSPQVQQIVADAAELTSRLNNSSKKLDNVLVNLDKFLGSDDAKGLSNEVRLTLVEFRRTARNLDSRIAEVTQSITSFSGRGLADTQNLIRDARRSINRIDRVMRNIESNPSSLITGEGGTRIRETSTRPRR